MPVGAIHATGGGPPEDRGDTPSDCPQMGQNCTSELTWVPQRWQNMGISNPGYALYGDCVQFFLRRPHQARCGRWIRPTIPAVPPQAMPGMLVGMAVRSQNQ